MCISSKNACLKVVPGHQTSPTYTFFYFLARITMSSLCPMHHGVINWLFYPGKWSHCCQGVNWDSIHSQPTNRFWIVAANCVGWSGRHQERSRESVCVCVYGPVTLHEWLKWRTRVKPLFQRKKKRKRGHLEHSQWNLRAHLRKVSPKSLGNFCAEVQLHSQAVLW